jgi:hypothetical protein
LRRTTLRAHARQRLGIERDHEIRVFGGGGLNFFHIENWYIAPWLIRNSLRLVGLYRRGRRNAERVEVRTNAVRSTKVPEAFNGFTLLQISDMHVEISDGALNHLVKLLPALTYDICVQTGDYRAKTFGPFDATLAGIENDDVIDVDFGDCASFFARGDTVECRVQPRLRINPGFVAAHAATPERLLMLVMHELHHVLLGHTTLFPTPTPAHNFVFDAVINGVISRMFPAPEYTSLLTGYYDAKSFPKCLLRPPPGWPGRPQIAGGILTLEEPSRSRARDIHAALYSEAGASYREVFELLPRLLGKDAIGHIPLLGGHAVDGAAKGGLEKRSPVLFDIVRSVVEQWPQPPHPIRGRSLASILETDTVQPKRPASARATLRSLMRKAASCGPSGSVRRPAVDTAFAPVPIPTLGRRTSVLRALGYEPLLHAGPVPWRRQVPAGERVHVYLDVSGSMDGVKNALYGAILDSQAYVHPTVHLFSTEVADISLSELRAGVCKSTGGTTCRGRSSTRSRLLGTI